MIQLKHFASFSFFLEAFSQKVKACKSKSFPKIENTNFEISILQWQSGKQSGMRNQHHRRGLRMMSKEQQNFVLGTVSGGESAKRQNATKEQETRQISASSTEGAGAVTWHHVLNPHEQDQISASNMAGVGVASFATCSSLLDATKQRETTQISVSNIGVVGAVKNRNVTKVQ